MTEPTAPSFRSHVDRPQASILVSGELHTPTAEDLEYNLNYQVDRTVLPSCAGLAVIFTGVPDAGQVLLLAPNHVIHHASQAGTEWSWTYNRFGTAVDETIMNEPHPFIKAAYQAAMKFKVTKTAGETNQFDVEAGNASVADSDVPEISYAGSSGQNIQTILDTAGITAGKWAKVLLAIIPNGTGGGTLGANCSTTGFDTSNEALADEVEPVDKGMPISFIVQRSGYALDENKIYSLDGRAYGGGAAGRAVADDYTNDEGTITRGMSVYLVGVNKVAPSDADVDAKMPAIGVVSKVITGTTCQVQKSGRLKLATGNANHGKFAAGDIRKSIYVDTTEGDLTLTRNTTPEQWDQYMGYVTDANEIEIIVGGHTKNEKGGGDPDDPDDPFKDPTKRRFQYYAGVVVGEFVHLVGTSHVDEAQANDIATMPAIGVVTAIDGIWATVENNFYWKTADHGGSRPSGVTAGALNDKWLISHTVAGEGQPEAAIIPAGSYVQTACIQTDDAGAEFFICCGEHVRVGDFDPTPEDNTFDCDNNVGEEDAVYKDGTTARPADAVDGTKLAQAIAIHVANNKCVLKYTGDEFKSQFSRSGSKQFLRPDVPGAWANDDNIIWHPGIWRQRVAHRLNADNLIKVDIGEGEFIGQIIIDEDDEEGIIDTIGPNAYADHLVEKGQALDFYMFALDKKPIVKQTGNSNSYPPFGICIKRELNPDGEPGNRQYLVWAITSGQIYRNTLAGWTPGATYYSSGTSGSMAPIIQFNKYVKEFGIALDESDFLVTCDKAVYFALPPGDVVPIDPIPGHGPVKPVIPLEKIRGGDGSSASPKLADGSSDEFVCEAHTFINTIDFSIESTGDGLNAYVECDVITGSGASILSSTCKLATKGDGVRGDTIPGSAYSTDHQRAVVKFGLMPLNPGQALHITWKKEGGFSTDPYGLHWVMNKYLVKAPAL